MTISNPICNLDPRILGINPPITVNPKTLASSCNLSNENALCILFNKFKDCLYPILNAGHLAKKQANIGNVTIKIDNQFPSAAIPAPIKLTSGLTKTPWIVSPTLASGPIKATLMLSAVSLCPFSSNAHAIPHIAAEPAGWQL